jgi:6-pyruvoyltetrahydropterin/6-carboxytetrahydropterin synthase
MITIIRHHDIDAGHRVSGHEGKCQHLHGHSYRVHFTCNAEKLDALGRVIDFSVIKSKLCMWLEDNWDHRFLAWNEDQVMLELMRGAATRKDLEVNVFATMTDSIVWTPFNPTAENIAEHLLRIVGPQQLEGTNVTLISVQVDETRKCSAMANLT